MCIFSAIYNPYIYSLYAFFLPLKAYFKMQSVLIDDRRIHVDFSQSVSRLHKDWISGKIKQQVSGFGGDSSLEKRTKYRSGERASVENYDLVFEHSGSHDEYRRNADMARHKERPSLRQ